MVKLSKEDIIKKRDEKLKSAFKISDYILANEAKARQVQGVLGYNGSDDAILAAYDKRGGLILKVENREVVPTGTFYDFEKKVAKFDKKVIDVKEDKKNGS